MNISSLIDIGGIPISISFDHPEFFRYFSRRYDYFHAAKLPRYNLFIDELKQMGNKSDKLVTNVERGTIQFYSNFYYGIYDLAKSTIKAKVMFHPITFDNFLRTIIGMISIQEQGILIQGLGYSENNNAYIITGGWMDTRQQLASIIPRNQLLTDSLVFVKFEKDHFTAYSTPFNSDLRSNPRNINLPVKALLFGRSGETNIIKDITKKDAIFKAMRLGFQVPCRKRDTQKYMELIEKFVNHVEVKSITLDMQSLDLSSFISNFSNRQ